MTRRISQRILLLAAALTFAASTAPAAQADSFRHTDATGDVVVTTTGSPGTSHVSPLLALPDIQSLTVLHTRWTVSVATVLRSVDGYTTSWHATIVTSKGERYEVIYARGAGPAPLVDLRLIRNHVHLQCDGLHVTRTTPGTSKGVIVKVPTRCLSNPWKVRVGVLVHTTYGDGAEPHVTGHDDALRTGAFTYYRPALSSWIAK